MTLNFDIGEKVFYLDTQSAVIRCGVISYIEVRATNLFHNDCGEILTLSYMVDYTVSKITGGEFVASEKQLFKTEEDCLSFYLDKLNEIKLLKDGDSTRRRSNH